jgi:sec-independent protein translocase protein TatC
MTAVTRNRSLRRPLRRRGRNPEGRMPVMDHLRELRRRVMWILLIVAAGAVVGYWLYAPILAFLKHPYCAVPPQYRYVSAVSPHSCTLTYTGVLQGFTTRLKISVIAGAVFTGPLWLYQIWAFITPGLRKNERRYTVVFVAVSTLLFAAGVALAYLVLAKGLRILLEAGTNQTQAILTVDSYISFVTLMLVVFGAAFELPLIVVMANMVGVLPYRLLRRSRRVSIFLIFLFAAVATPTTDPFTMCAMAIPMVLLFEVAVQIARVHDKRKARRREAERAAELAADHSDDAVPSTIDPIPRRLDAAGDDAVGVSWTDTT